MNTHTTIKNAIPPLYALFTAMSTSIGMGTIVGPSIAILTGGPGALFWLLIYIFIGSIIKFVEVTFSVHLRSSTPDGRILGGPMQYLKFVNPWLASWYTGASIILFAGWSGLQANVLGELLHEEGIPLWLTGIVLALIIFFLLRGGAERVGKFNSRLVPIMCVLYLSVIMLILLLNSDKLISALLLIGRSIFGMPALIGGALAFPFLATFQAGMYKGAFITEAGMGTAAIPHAFAQVNHPTDQGSLAMTSMYIDMLLCALSGLVILITNSWHTSTINNTIMYHIFSDYLPFFGKPFLLLSLALFVLGTALGNSYNGRQSFASITGYRWLLAYNIFICFVISLGSIIEVPLAWTIMDCLLPLVAIPHIIGLIILSIKYAALFQGQ